MIGADGMPSDDLRPRRLHDDPSAPASDDVAAARDRQRALLNQGPQRVDDRRRVPVRLVLSCPRLRGQPRGERLLADLLANRTCAAP